MTDDLHAAADDAMRDRQEPDLTDAEAVEEIARVLRECNLPAWSDTLDAVRRLVERTGRSATLPAVHVPRSGFCTFCGLGDHLPEDCSALPC